MKLTITSDALRDRRNAIAYLNERSPSAARRIDKAISRDLRTLQRTPLIGRPRLGGTRESVVQRTPYIIVYEVLDREIVVLRIWHHAQDRLMLD